MPQPSRKTGAIIARLSYFTFSAFYVKLGLASISDTSLLKSAFVCLCALCVCVGVHALVSAFECFLWAWNLNGFVQLFVVAAIFGFIILPMLISLSWVGLSIIFCIWSFFLRSIRRTRCASNGILAGVTDNRESQAECSNSSSSGAGGRSSGASGLLATSKSTHPGVQTRKRSSKPLK